MARKARVEGAQTPAQTVTGHPASEDLSAIVEAFKSAHPDEWNALRLCPLQHGLEAMIERLK